MNEILARITVSPETKRIKDLSIHRKHLWFRCKRCGVFCCRLGGPKLTRKDIERIKQAGYDVKGFLEPVSNSEFKGFPIMCGSLKSKEDGSCVFLKFDVDKDCYECSIYNSRPFLCRLYPFDFDRTSPSTIALKVIPCCRGLNNSDGEQVDEEFITNYLLEALLEVMGLI